MLTLVVGVLATAVVMIVDVGPNEVAVRDFRGWHRFDPGDRVRKRIVQLVIGRSKYLELSCKGGGQRVGVPLFLLTSRKASRLEAALRGALGSQEE